MTGTGSQMQPYKPENWEEFVEAVGTSGAYVSCPDNAVWNMNESMPVGITSSIFIRAKQILGNNTTIKNLTFTNSGNLNFNLSGTEIIKLNFLNIYTTMDSTACFYNNGGTVFRNCKFSGIISHGSFLSGGYYSGFNFTNDTGDNPKGCSFNFEFYGNGNMYTNTSSPPEVKFTNCNIHISGENDAGVSKAFLKCRMTNCYISGKCPSKAGIYVSLDSNVYDIEVPEGQVDIYNSVAKTVINNSLVDASYTNGNGVDYLIKATEEQMHDAEYLKSQGFMIGVG